MLPGNVPVYLGRLLRLGLAELGEAQPALSRSGPPRPARPAGPGTSGVRCASLSWADGSGRREPGGAAPVRDH